MIEAVFPDLFRIEVPLPKNPLKSVNSYVVRGGDRNLVIDTGMNRPECLEALRAGLAKVGADPAQTDCFITHLHADHLGLVTELTSPTSRAYFNGPEAAYITEEWQAGKFRMVLADHARREGIPEQGIRDVLQLHPGFKYSPPKYPEFEILHDGDQLRVGDYLFTCVHTPGHTPGHLCLYEPNRKVLISGDHILGDITPNIASWIDDRDTLGEYFASLDKVSTLDVELVLPGHRRTLRNMRGRIAELKEHHRHRLDEALAIVKARPSTAYETAARMTWDIVAASWDDFPLLQKWFATGEAGSHLRHLIETGAATRTEENGVFIYAAR